MFKETKFSEIKNNSNKLNIDGISADRYRCFIDGDVTYLTFKEVVGRHVNCGGVVVKEWNDLCGVTDYICLKCDERLTKHCFVDLDEDIIKDYEEHLKFLSDYIVAHKETLKDYCNDKHDIVGELDSDGFTNDASRHTYNVLKNNGFVDKAYVKPQWKIKAKCGNEDMVVCEFGMENVDCVKILTCTDISLLDYGEFELGFYENSTFKNSHIFSLNMGLKNFIVNEIDLLVITKFVDVDYYELVERNYYNPNKSEIKLCIENIK